MRFPGTGSLAGAARRGRTNARLALSALARMRRPLKGRFQPYNYTVPDRYPWLFKFAAGEIGHRDPLSLLSFGCSSGDEVFSLANYFPHAHVRGIEIDPRNVAVCRSRTRCQRVSFTQAASTADEPSAAYDAIFCLAVLCLADLTTSGAERCDPYLRFTDFERVVVDFARCLKPGGLLLLHTANFRFEDTVASRSFDVALTADPAELAPDVLFDRNNRLLPGQRYLPVGFRKCE